MNKERVVIIGGGHAGGSAAAFLRQYGFTGTITIIGSESNPPYQRPPLSKAYIKGVADSNSLLLRPSTFYQEKNIDIKLNTSVTRIDRNNKTVETACGETLSYEYLIIATGSRPRVLNIPGKESNGIIYLRSIEDAERLKSGINPDTKVAIIGGGYIGLEVAASARGLGADVTVIEQEPTLLSRVASNHLSGFLLNAHQEQGVNFLLSASVTDFNHMNGQLESVSLSNGQKVDCDIAVVGIGAIPNTEIANYAGIRCSNGITVDRDSRTSDPHIFAIGDVANRYVSVSETNLRLESVQNALEQAKVVANNIVKKPNKPEETPWFWSDQYDYKLQIAGMKNTATSQVVRKSNNANGLSVFHLKNNRLVSVECINSPVDFMQGKKLIHTDAKMDSTLLSNADLSLRDCVLTDKLELQS
ncbi:FAD-dependent oxidoreductase [Photobacterium makurazakiensis]|uniref:NAD(P)/FAD-dependent oxidoreductase n=1 Tax=Photobacterium makurazakiensis TaxID=2910234 RepID=UPI003D0B1F02